MRQLHIITSLSTGGAERALYSLLRGGLAKPKDVAVISLRDEGTYGPPIRALGIPLYAIGMQHGLQIPLAIIRLRHLVNVLRPCVIQGWMYHGNLAASLAGKLSSGDPAVAWNVRHSLYCLAKEKRFTREVIKANRRLSDRADSILYNSRISREQHEAFGFYPDRGNVIPNGFDVGTLRPSKDIRDATRRRLEIPSQGVVIGHVARFHPMKDHASFLRAAVRVMKQRADVFCVLVGRNVSRGTPELAGILPNDILARFRFMGERSDVPDLIRAMDILCTSSAWGEAFPNVLGEAMALEVPCVATDVGDSREIVDDTGVVVPPSDSGALAEGLFAMVSMPAADRLALGRAARARVEERYTLHGSVSRYSDLYERLARSNR